MLKSHQSDRRPLRQGQLLFHKQIEMEKKRRKSTITAYHAEVLILKNQIDLKQKIPPKCTYLVAGELYPYYWLKLLK